MGAHNPGEHGRALQAGYGHGSHALMAIFKCSRPEACGTRIYLLDLGCNHLGPNCKLAFQIASQKPAQR